MTDTPSQIDEIEFVLFISVILLLFCLFLFEAQTRIIV